VAEVPGQAEEAQVGVACREPEQDVPRAVARAVVDEHDLVFTEGGDCRRDP
jgi:hypothetical protein